TRTSSTGRSGSGPRGTSGRAKSSATTTTPRATRRSSAGAGPIVRTTCDGRLPHMSAPALLYLHGFASSPQSSKARFFVERARAAGLPADCPDLNQPDFGTLTVTRMIERVRDAAAAMPAGPVALVGSSLGAFVALHAVAQPGWDPARPVERLVFLAPALDLAPGLARDFGPERMAEWERTGWIEIFHY